MALTIQRNFAAGELSPELYGRADLAIYGQGARALRNFTVMRHGGATNRAGFQFIAELKDSAVKTYLLKFVFNPDQTYILEAGTGYFRFYRLGARIAVSGVTAWSNVTNYIAGDLASRLGVNYYCILAHANQQPPNAAYWYPLTSAIFEIPTPYAAADIEDLQFFQQGDILTLVHPAYAPRRLRRYGHTRWTLTTFVTAPATGTPQALVATPGAAGALNYAYAVTAVGGDNEESLRSAPATAACVAPAAAAPNTLAWTGVTGAREYNVFLDRDGNGVYGFIGVAATNAFKDTGLIPDMSFTPPIARSLFAAAGDYPSTGTYYQERLVLGGSDNEPDKATASRTGYFTNFTTSSPIQDDDSVSFRITSRQVSAIRHLIEVGKLVALTSTVECVIHGDQDGTLLPTAINRDINAHYGASSVRPAVVGNNVIYIQARGGIVRDLRFDQSVQGYRGSDLTLFASHLFKGRSVVRMDFAQMPDNVVWCVRDDGILLGLTYIPDQQVWGWHRHDTGAGGVFEDVCVVPESTPAVPGSALRGPEEDAVYVTVKRTINGSTRRYIEHMASRRVEDDRLDAYFSDSFLSYNGINDDATRTIALSTAGGWTLTDVITVRANAALFTAADAGLDVWAWNPPLGAGVAKIRIDTYVSPAVVRGHIVSAGVDAGVQNVPAAYWSKTASAVSGLSHLEGETVAILADGNVLSQAVVSGGAVTLGRPYAVVHVGLPITAQMELLDLDPADSLVRDRQKHIKAVSLVVVRSRGIWAGPDAAHLNEYKPAYPATYGTPVAPVTGVVEIPMTSTWNGTGRVLIEQRDPLPVTALAVMPVGTIGG